MNILVVGSRGQLARSLVTTRRPGLEVTSLGRTGLDLRSPEKVAAAIKANRPDLVINAAAYTAVDRAESEAEEAHAVNAIGAGTLAAACRTARIPLIHISTDYVFNGTSIRPYVEDDPIDPINAYGRTKSEGEKRVLDACPQSIVLRTSWVHSPYGRNFIMTILELAASRPEIAVIDDQLGCPTYGPHLAAAALQIAERAGDAGFSSWGVYNACGTGETTWCGLALEALSVSKWLRGPSAEVKAITTAEYPLPARRPRNSRLDCSKLVRVFGISLPNWRIGVALGVGEIIGRKKTEAAA